MDILPFPSGSPSHGTRTVATDRLRVMLVSTQRVWRGGEEQASLLADGLRRRGHDCEILARAGGEFADRMQTSGFCVTTFPGRGHLPLALWSNRRVLQRVRPDVLHYNDPHALLAAGLAAWGLSIPLRVAARRVDFPLNSAAHYRKLSDVTVCVSRAVQQVCSDSGLDSSQLTVVHDGVDPRRMTTGQRSRGRAVVGVDDSATVLLTVAKLTDHKGHQYLLQALPELLRHHGQIVWAVAGDGPLRGPLESLAQRLGIQHAVRFLGHRRDIPDLLAAADLMVVPSQMEGLCSSIVDAMLFGLPVVATRAGGIPDLLDSRSAQQPEVAWLVPPRDPAALAKAILDVQRFPHLTGQRVAMARQRALQEFTADEMVERTLRTYRQWLRAEGSVRRAA
jgi:glycosyltransferase involved in cell wall biosynthesis